MSNIFEAYFTRTGFTQNDFDLIDMSAKNWCFTINNPEDGDRANLEYLNPELHRQSLDCNYVIYQLEKGEHGTPHYQGYLQFTKRKTLNQIKSILGSRSHLEVARGSPLANKEYCSKEESRVLGQSVVELGSMRGGQGTRTDIEEFVNAIRRGPLSTESIIEQYSSVLAKYPRFVRTVVDHYTTTITRTPCLEPRIGWQSELFLDLTTDPHPRTVRWYYDPVGGTGKSLFARRFSIGGDPIHPRAYIVTGGRHSDVFFGYRNERVVFFDWARDNQETFPYLVVENFKNGYFLNTKYEVQAKYFNPPHVVIFANFEPDQTKLSQDRWIIKNI